MFVVTVILDSPGAVAPGDVVRLIPGEAADAVDVCLQSGGEYKKIGYVTNEAKDSLPDYGPAMSAARLCQKIFGNALCGVVNGLVLKPRSQNQTGRSYSVEIFATKKRSGDQKVKKEPLRYTVGGISAKCPTKAALLNQISQTIKDGKPVNIPVTVLREIDAAGASCYYCCSDAVRIDANSGMIANADDRLDRLLAPNGTIDATAVAMGTKNSYIIEITPPGTSIASLYPVIDEMTLRCADTSKNLEEKAVFMKNANFPDRLAEIVLRQTPVLGSAYPNLAKPKMKYRQAKGNNLMDVVSYMLRGMTVRLVGEKGAGKNTLVETACWLLGRPLCRVQGSAELDKMDILGFHTLEGGSTGFRLSAMLCTLISGGIVVIDEANTVSPEVLTLLHSLTDASRSIDVPGYGLVRMDDHACIIYTMNEEYIGTGEMNAATVDRGPSLIIEQEKNMGELLKCAVPDAKEEEIDLCVKISDEIRRVVGANSSHVRLSKDAITVRGYIDALKTSEFIPLKRGLIQNVANKAQTASERASIETIISTFIG